MGMNVRLETVDLLLAFSAETLDMIKSFSTVCELRLQWKVWLGLKVGEPQP